MRIAYSIALSIPFIGTWIAFLLFGGEFPSDQIISRLFFTHVFLVPLLIITLLSVHLALVWRQKHTQFPGGGRTDRNVHGIRFWPSYATESVGLFFGAVVTSAMPDSVVRGIGIPFATIGVIAPD